MSNEKPSPLALAEFRRRLIDTWLPAYCNDVRRDYPLAGFRDDFELAECDASDFLFAVDRGLITDTGGGRWGAPRSACSEVIFWEGEKAIVPRPVSLWLEPVITAGVLARMHRDFGWPVELLGMQSTDWAFDAVAYRPDQPLRSWISIEVKKNARELNALIDNMNHFCGGQEFDASTASGSLRNAWKKWLSLGETRPAVFWAVGPGGLNKVFRVEYSATGVVSLDEVDHEGLLYLRAPK
jgi:hypothetical protein